MKPKPRKRRHRGSVIVLAVVGVSALVSLTLEGGLSQVGCAATESRFSAHSRTASFLRPSFAPTTSEKPCKYVPLSPAGFNADLRKCAAMYFAAFSNWGVQGAISATLKVSQNFVPLSFSANATVEAPPVFAGYGITAPKYHYDDYQDLDATARVVSVLRHEPQEMTSIGSSPESNSLHILGSSTRPSMPRITAPKQ